MKKAHGFLFAAGVSLALAFIFSCGLTGEVGEDDGGGGGSVSEVTVDLIYTPVAGCNGCEFTEENAEKWNGNGTVKMEIGACDTGLYVGEIVNGTLSLNLPSASEIPESCFRNAAQAFDGASVSTPDAKVVLANYYFHVVSDGKPYTLKWELKKGWRNAKETVRGHYTYFSKATKITGKITGESSTANITINASEGWNELYVSNDYYDESYNIKYTTDPNDIEVKPIWYIYYNNTSED
jgi:hypothetical protein